MSHRYDHQEGVCLQRQSSAEKSSDNKLPHKFLSVFKLNQFTTQFMKSLKSYFIRQGHLFKKMKHWNLGIFGY